MADLNENNSDKPKTNPDVIVIKDEDLIIEDAPQKKTKAYLKPFKNTPRIRSAVEYGVEQILIPAGLSMVHRFLYSIVDFIVYNGPRSAYNPNGGTDYNKPYRTDDPFASSYSSSGDVYFHERPYRTSKNESFDLHRLGFRSRDAAESCLEYLRTTIDYEGRVSVEKLYKYLGKPSPSRMSWQWGWLSIDHAPIESINGGWRIIFPEVVNLR